MAKLENLRRRLAVGLALGLGAVAAAAQIERLPPAPPAEVFFWDEFPAVDASPSPPTPETPVWDPLPDAPGALEPVFPIPEVPLPRSSAEEPDADEPRASRPGVFQNVVFESTWLVPGAKAGDFGMLDLDLRSVFGFPCPTRSSPLVVTPGFAVHFFDGPTRSDLPGEVYDAFAQFRWTHRLLPRLRVDAAVTPGWYSDLRQGSGEALRISGHGAGIVTWGPTTKIVFGLSYLDRKDVEFLPLGGLVWTPNEDTSFELVSPRPRIARRVYWLAPRGDGVQDWVYVAGEFGGGAWAVRRASGLDDLVAYRDYRLMLGTERKRTGGLSGVVEMGYVFGRKLEYDRFSPDVKPADTLLIRGGLIY